MRTEEAFGLNKNPFLPNQPLRLDRVRPRALHREETGQISRTPWPRVCLTCRLCWRRARCARSGSRARRRCPRSGARRRLPLGPAAKCRPRRREVNGDGTDRTPVHEAQPHVVAALALRVPGDASGGRNRPRPWGPGRHLGRRCARSLRRRMRGRRPARRAAWGAPADSTRPRPRTPGASRDGPGGPDRIRRSRRAFLRHTPGSGLVIQCLARRQRTPMRGPRWRGGLAADPPQAVKPCAYAHLGGQLQGPYAGRLLGKSRGLRCKSARKRSACSGAEDQARAVGA